MNFVEDIAAHILATKSTRLVKRWPGKPGFFVVLSDSADANRPEDIRKTKQKTIGTKRGKTDRQPETEREREREMINTK